MCYHSVRFIRNALTLFAISLCAPCLAQDYDSGAAVDMTGMSILSQETAMINASRGDTRERLLASPRPIATAMVPRLTYKSTIVRTRANLAKFVEKTRAVDPAGAAKMQALFASTDIIGMIDQKMQQTYGMRANNVADAYAVWWVSAWMGSRGRSDDATPGQMAMVKRQAANALSATPEFASATDAGKQEMAEAMLVQAALIGDTIDTYQSDPAMLAKTRTAIAKGAREMGIDLNSMKLTDEGFRPSGKTGALDPAPDQQQASATPAPATSVAPPYALMAAAGGAGLGGVFLLGKMMGRRG